MNRKIRLRKSAILRMTIFILSLLLIVSSVTAVCYGVKYRNSTREVSKLNGEINDNSSAYDSKVSEYESYKNEKESEVQSYEDKLSEKDSKIDELNKKIDSLNKQLAAKKATTQKPVVPPAIPSGGKTVYLTFDDGPSQYTLKILDILDSYGVKATFFVINGKYNSTMKDIVNRGHQIALHTYSHNYKAIYSSDEAYYSDLQKISDVVYSQTGVRTNIIRFPGGSSNGVSKKYSKGIMTRLSKSILEKGYIYFDWNCTNGDADGANTVSKQLNYCSQFPKSANNIVVLMHDSKESTMNALPKIIEYYKSCGMNFGVITSSTPPVRHNITN